ncbi:MAG: oxidoreductase, partial [Anaerolineae bacterium]|nr:oxidoreductase [Anaerolineae bacterium]
GQTVGLIGFGHIGSLLPGLLRPFGVRVLAYDPYVADAVFAAQGAERVREMDALLAESDIVSLHARVTPETRGFIGEPQFRRMKRGAYFINTARGPMVDYDALYRALADGHLAGAGLETFALEPPPPDWPLLRLPNVTLTPHIAGCSQQSVHLAAALVCADIAAWSAGEKPVNCANPEVLLEESS